MLTCRKIETPSLLWFPSVSGNIRDPLKPLFLTLEPPNYWNWIKKTTQAILGYCFQARTLIIGKFETKMRAETPSRIVSSILASGIDILKQTWNQHLNIFNSNQGYLAWYLGFEELGSWGWEGRRLTGSWGNPPPRGGLPSQETA